MNCSEIKPNLEAYALGALDPYHATRVEKHLKTCAACRHTLASFREAVGELPHALTHAAPLKPPAHLKARVMQAVAEENQAREHVRAMQETFASRAVAPLPRGRRGAWLTSPRSMLLALSTAGLVIAALMFWVVSTNSKLQQALDNELGAREQLAAQSHQVLNTLEDPRTVYLFAADASSNAYGKLLFDPNKRDVVFLAYNLPQPGLSRRYILWTRNKGYMQRVAQFMPDPKGNALANFKVDYDLVLKEVYVTEQLPSYPLPVEPKILRWVSDKSEDY